MCGISGIVKLDGASTELVDAARRMNATIRHRGPDGEGFLVAGEDGQPVPAYSEETPGDITASRFPHTPSAHIASFTAGTRLILSHRRLAIVDLSPAGHQPLCTADGQLWITYNGEVYNYPELRTELESLGHTFFTHTDTEVILAAYRQWGTECLHRFNGMWAFAIWDRQANKLFCSRDRFGVKPFYYYRDNNVFTFASEQKALLKNPFVKTSLNTAAVADYFVAGEIEYRPESFFKNIIELFPGCAGELSLSDGKFRTWKWYTLPAEQEKAEYTDAQYQRYIEETRELVVDAVRLRLRSDVPVGSCLSGGIDSSAIAGIIGDLVGRHEKVNIGEQLKLFTAVFNEPDIDERKWAQEMVQRTGAEWHTVLPEPAEFVRDLEDLVRCQDVPIWSTSTYAQYRVMKLVHEKGIKVVLDGQGGDELFAGYHPYYIPFWNELKSAGLRKLMKAEMRAFGPDANAYRRRETLKQRTFPKLPLNLQLAIQRRYFPDVDYLDRQLTEEFLARRSKPVVPETLNEALAGEFTDSRLKGYLKCEDRCSMRFSVESRTPFSEDHRLIEAVFRMPGTMKIRDGVTKYILREAAAPFIPEGIRTRRDKLGYATPNNKWITQLRDQFRPYFEQDFSGMIDQPKLLRDYDSFFSVEGKPENGRIFKFIAFAVWKKVSGL